MESSVPSEQFLKQIDEAGPRSLFGKLVVANSIDLEIARVRVGEAMGDVAVAMDLPIGPGIGQLLAKRDHLLGPGHWVVPAVKGRDLRLDLLAWQIRRIEQAVEAHGSRELGAGPRKVKRAHPAKTIAGDNDLLVGHLLETLGEFEHVEQTPAECRPVALQPVHLAEHGIARCAAELLAEKVGYEGIIAKLDKLPSESDLQVGHAHDSRNQDHRRSRLAVAASDKDTFQA